MVVLAHGRQQLSSGLEVADDELQHALLGRQRHDGIGGCLVVVLEEHHFAPGAQQVEVSHAAHQVSLAHCLVLHFLAHFRIAVAGNIVQDGVGEGDHGVHGAPGVADVLRQAGGLEEGHFGVVVGIERVVGAQRTHADDGVVIVVRPRLVIEWFGGLDDGLVRRVEGLSRVLVEGRTVEEVFAATRHAQRQCAQGQYLEYLVLVHIHIYIIDLL